MSNWLKVTSFDKRDEYYTPALMVYPIIEFIKPGATIWCPFDTKDSEFVRVFTESGFKVIYSHLWLGQDFFEYEPEEHYDYIISNPPFTKKMDVFRRLYDLNKPFAMVLGLPILNYQVIGEFFLDKNLELLIFDKKVSFDGNTSSFNCSYFCNGILPRGIIFYHLPHNNTGQNFIPSGMAA
ncbi:MAG: tRNA (adenine-N(6)-)-methyltransferase [Bacteroidales bacterium]|jgi:hypothetical protein|nr:tRNA (adenine-N(6)-)-methyltransferase [Bacteroidales bacterium]